MESLKKMIWVKLRGKVGLFQYRRILEKYVNNDDISKTAILPLNFTPGLMRSYIVNIYASIHSKYS